MKSVLLPLFLLISSITIAQVSLRTTEIDFREVQSDSIEVKIDSLLLIGAGSSVTRIFLDDFSDYLMQRLSTQKVATKYLYVEEKNGITKNTLDTLSKKGYKAILCFVPYGSSLYDVQGGIANYSTNTGSGSLGVGIANTSVKYNQDFNFEMLIAGGGKMKRAWYALVGVSCNLQKSTAAKKLAKQVLAVFKQNKYL